MERKQLSRYKRNKRDIEKLDGIIKKLQSRLDDVPVVSGKVTKSSDDFPYIEQHVQVKVEEPKEATALKLRIREKEKRKKQLIRENTEVEKFIAAMPEGTTRDVFEMVFLDGMTQKDAAECIADKDTMFQNPQFEKDESLIYDGVAHIDAAYDGADGTAFTIFRQQDDGSIIGFGKRWDKHVDDCLAEITFLHKKYRAGTIENEDNADKGYLKKELKNIGLPVHGYHESMNKYIKISTYLRSNWRAIRWLEDTDPEYINEILDYSEHAEHDDSPDSAASLLRKMQKKQAKYNRGGV